jgi:hypothetical protein
MFTLILILLTALNCDILILLTALNCDIHPALNRERERERERERIKCGENRALI